MQYHNKLLRASVEQARIGGGAMGTGGWTKILGGMALIVNMYQRANTVSLHRRIHCGKIGASVPFGPCTPEQPRLWML